MAALSGTQAKAEGRGVSYFDVTQPPDLATLLSNKNTQAEALSIHLGGIPAQALSFLAGAMSVQPTIVEVSRGVRLAITPTALATGSAAELVVDLEVGEGDAKPKQVGAEGTVDALDRITKHTVQTKVRVEALRLFEVSTFSNHVTRPIPDKPWPVVGTAWHAFFAPIPGLNRLFLSRRKPETVSHRSLVMV